LRWPAAAATVGMAPVRAAVVAPRAVRLGPGARATKGRPLRPEAAQAPKAAEAPATLPAVQAVAARAVRAPSLVAERRARERQGRERQGRERRAQEHPARERPVVQVPGRRGMVRPAA
jgi:hypothetical protein